MPTFTPVDGDPFAEAPEASAAGGSVPSSASGPRLVPVEGDPFAQPEKPSAAGGIARAFGAGVINGAIATPGFLADRGQDAMRMAAHAGDRLRQAVGLAPNDPRAMAELEQPMPGTTAFNKDLVERAIGPLHRPETVAEEYAHTLGEFAPGVIGTPGGAIAKAAGVVLPALAAETAGQITKGTPYEGVARVGAGLVAGVGHGLATAPSRVERLATRSLAELPAAERDAALREAQRLLDEAKAQGIPLSSANAIDTAAKGATDLSGLQRHVEATGRMRPFYAQMPDAVERAGRSTLDQVAPRVSQPAVLGGEVRDAARAAVAQTPEGQAVARAQEAVGPRVTPEEAGQVIQPALQRVYDRREGMRAALGDVEYAAAREAPETVGIERQVAVERPGQPIVTYPQGRPQFTEAAPRPLETFQRPDAEAAAAGPESLARFVARNGGLRLDGDVTATDLHRFTIPGLGNVARPSGRGIDDFWREHLITHGYLKPDADGGAARDITSELLRKLQNEQRGVPSYPIGAERAPVGRSVSRQADEYSEALATADARLSEDLRGAGVPPETVHPDVRARVLGALMRGEDADPITAYERTVNAMREPPAPYVKSTTVTEQIPDVRFGQANPQAVVDHIDEALRTAKGPVAKALGDARKTLFTPGGRDLDQSVEGLHNARVAINDLVAKAEPGAQRALLGVRDELDRALSSVPEYEHARSGFEAASRPLDAFAEGSVPGRVVARDQVSGRSTMAPEKVPEAIAEGPTGARAFNDVAPPEARQAMEGRLATQILDSLTDKPGTASAQAIRTALRRHEDLFRQFPGVRDRLQEVAAAHDGIEVVNRSPLGKIASRPDAQAAIEALFPTGAKGVSAEEVGQAVQGLVRNSPLAARSLVRMHAEQVFDGAAKALQSGPNQMGGAKFATALRGNKAEAANLDAALRALPRGDVLADGFGRLLDVLEAGGRRQNVGSRTAYNAQDLADMGKGGKVEAGFKMIATGGVKLPAKAMATIEEWRQGKNLDRLASLFASPDAVGAFRGLLEARNPAPHIAQLVSIATRSARSGEASREP